MAENTLSTYPFERTIVKTRMQPQERYALAHIAEPGEPGMGTVRRLLCAGLEAMGWDEARRVEEYAKYKAHCLRTGTTNEFESR